MENTRQVTVSQAALSELERRSLQIDTALHCLIWLLNDGDVDKATSAAQLVQELNRTQRAAVIAAGAIDSMVAGRGSSPRRWDDEEPPIDADGLDLAAIRSEFGAGE